MKNRELQTNRLRNGVKITTALKPITVEEWIAEGEALFGRGILGYRFQCPMCGKTWSVDEFRREGGDVNSAYQECIGRHLGAGAPGSPDGNPNGCNWAAYGVFGIPNGKGRLVLAPDGDVVEVFDYAREEARG